MKNYERATHFVSRLENPRHRALVGAAIRVAVTDLRLQETSPSFDVELMVRVLAKLAEEEALLKEILFGDLSSVTWFDD